MGCHSVFSDTLCEFTKVVFFFNPCHDELIKRPRLFLKVSQSDALIKIVDINS